MKLRCTIGSINFITGRPPVTQGEIFEAEATLAEHLIQAGHAVPITEEAPKQAVEHEPERSTEEMPKRTARGRK